MVKDILKQMNYYGATKTPFFFLIDYEMQKPILMPLAELPTSDISFSIGGVEYGRIVDGVNERITISANNPCFELYRKKTDRVKAYINCGDTYLLNLTGQTLLNEQLNLESIYYNASSQFKIFKLGDFVSFSPEKFITIQDNKIFSFPMKGTISANTAFAEQSLLGSQKELCEHYTIVDLIRNDLAMVSSEVDVSRFRYIDRITAQRGDILQTSSEIVGKLPYDWQENIGDIIFKQLPAGSISGAPKKRSVEIIREVEDSPRGYYTGVCGVFDGECLRSCVVIRYIEKIENDYYYRSGGGITSMSVDIDEFNELIDKIYVPTI